MRIPNNTKFENSLDFTAYCLVAIGMNTKAKIKNIRRVQPYISMYLKSEIDFSIETEENYTQIPKELILDDRMNPLKKYLFFILSKHFYGDIIYEHKLKDILAEYNFNYRTFKSYVKDLVSLGYIKHSCQNKAHRFKFKEENDMFFKTDKIEKSILEKVKEEFCNNVDVTYITGDDMRYIDVNDRLEILAEILFKYNITPYQLSEASWNLKEIGSQFLPEFTGKRKTKSQQKKGEIIDGLHEYFNVNCRSVVIGHIKDLMKHSNKNNNNIISIENKYTVESIIKKLNLSVNKSFLLYAQLTEDSSQRLKESFILDGKELPNFKVDKKLYTTVFDYYNNNSYDCFDDMLDDIRDYIMEVN